MDTIKGLTLIAAFIGSGGRHLLGRYCIGVPFSAPRILPR